MPLTKIGYHSGPLTSFDSSCEIKAYLFLAQKLNLWLARAKEIIETEALEEELEAGVFTHYIAPPGVNFKDLPENNWSAERLPKVKESDVCDYLKKHGGYTKNYRTMTMKKETMTISIKSLVNLPFPRLLSVTSSHGLL